MQRLCAEDDSTWKCYTVRQHHASPRIKSIPKSITFRLGIKRATLN